MRIAAALAAAGLTAFNSLAASQTPAARRPSTEAAVPFTVGESLTYDVSWSSSIVAGSAVAAVREKRASFGSTAYYIVAEGRPLPMLARLYNLYYKMDTLIDTATLLSQRGSLYSEEGAKHQFGVTRFDRAARRAFFELQGEITGKTDFFVPPQTQDGLAVFYALRTRTLKAGERVTTPISDGGALYTLTATVAASEQIRVPLGQFQAWRMDVNIVDAQGEIVWKNIALWISNDPRRLPLKMQADLPVGQFVLALRDLSPPR